MCLLTPFWTPDGENFGLPKNKGFKMETVNFSRRKKSSRRKKYLSSSDYRERAYPDTENKFS